jgi:hypothetical protein
MKNKMQSLWLDMILCTIHKGGSMTHVEQHRMILELKDVVHRMTRDDEELFAMYMKRDKDDEDLDVVSQTRMEAMYGTYVVRKGRKS